MSLPYLNTISASQTTVGTFKGLNQKLVTSEGEFSALKNTSDRNYPAISSREPRGTCAQSGGSDLVLSSCHGIYYKNGLFYVNGTKCYYNGNEISGLAVADTDKQLVGMGAYICIFPDNKIYNTSDGSIQTITLTSTVSSVTVAPATSGSVFAKLSGANIGSGFKQNQYVTFSAANLAGDVKNLAVNKEGGYSGAITSVIFDGGTVAADALVDRAIVINDIPAVVTANTATTITFASTDFGTIADDAVISPLDLGSHVITEIADDNSYLLFSKQITTTSTETITIARALPENVTAFDYVCESGNRLWACSNTNHEVYASALGDPTNWLNYEGSSIGSYAMTVGSDGDFTGCTAHSGHVIFFKENTIHMVYGDKPSNYSLTTKQLAGALYHRSLETVNETLYYVGRNGVYSFDGAYPTKISDNIKSAITDAVSAQDNGKLYISCKLAGTQTIICYNPSTQLWEIEDDDEFKFSYLNNYVDKSNKLTTISGSRSETIEWDLESGDIVESSLDEKYISKIKLNVWLAKGSELYIYLNFDDGPIWVPKGHVISTKNTTYTFPIVPQRCNKFRYRLTGKGEFKLLGLSRQVEKGSEINGHIQY